MKTNFTYYDNGRIKALTHNRFSGTPTLIDGYTYQYDAANRLTEFGRTLGSNRSAEKVDYAYDPTGQLIKSSYASGAPLGDEAYVYDDNGNRKIQTPSVKLVFHGPHNRVTSNGHHQFTFDAEGNLVQRVDLATDETYEYEWDHRNRLIKVRILDAPSGNVQTVVQYDYDWMNQLIGKQLDDDSDGDTDRREFYIYDAGQVVLQFDGTGSGDVSHRYLWGPAVDQLLAAEDTTTDEVYWPLADHLGTVRDIVSHDKSTPGTTSVSHRVYDAFGNLKSETGPVAITDLVFGYTGRMFDSEAGLQNNLNRWYDAPTGRWLSEDPIGFAAGDANLYRYVGNGVTGATDPSGLADSDWGSFFYSEDLTGPPQLVPFRNCLGEPPDLVNPGYTLGELCTNGIGYCVDGYACSVGEDARARYLLDRWLYGGGDYDWSLDTNDQTMREHGALAEKLAAELKDAAYQLTLKYPQGTGIGNRVPVKGSSSFVFPENNYGPKSLYGYLHGGEIKWNGTAMVECSNQSDYRVTFSMTFVWEDDIDMNFSQGD